MDSKKKLLNTSRLYLILDRDVCKNKNSENLLKKAITGGVDIVQYRDKTSSPKEALRLAEKFFAICKKSGVPFIINDRLDIALAINADGIHLGQDDLPIHHARKILGATKIIGLSCHNLSDVSAARRKPCDYIGFGPVFKTLTKPGVKPRGIKALKKALDIYKKPVFAIGGITEKRLIDMNKLPNLKIAVIRQICLATDAESAARKLTNRNKHV